MSKLIGVDCPFFGKMLYIYMANGYDKSKITFLRFLQKLIPLWEPENRPNYNVLIFKMLDIDNDGCLNILNLLHLRTSLPNLKSMIGFEIFNLIDFFIVNFLTKGSLASINSANLGINYEVFSRIIVKSCLIDQIRNLFFNLKPREEIENVFIENHERDDEQLEKDDCWFSNITVDIIDDVSRGQRGYERNLEGLFTRM